MFVKDPSRDFKNEIASLKVPCIAKVIGYDKLKRDFKQYKYRRDLLRDYDLFLADLRIYKMLPEVLGKAFYEKKKFPSPLKLHGFKPKELKEQLNKAAKATYFVQGNGPNYAVKIARTSQDPSEVAENLEAALSYALGHVCMHDKIKFTKIQSISLKVGESPELPIFNQLTKSEVLAYVHKEQ